MKKIILLLFFGISFQSEAQNLNVAILDFENISGVDKYDGLGKALSNMLISDLSQNIDKSRINFLERSQLNKLLDEQNLQLSNRFDETTAVEIGKLIGVDYVILGSVFILNETSSFNSRMVNVETSEIIFSEESSGNISNWLALKSSLAEKLSTSLNNPIEVPKTISEQMTSEEVLTTFARAIESIDNSNLDEAEAFIQELKQLQSSFAYADNLSDEITGLKKQVDSNTQRIDEISRSGGLILNPESLADYRNNLMSDRLSFEKRRERRREMVTAFDVTYNDLFINELYSNVSQDVYDDEFNKDINFIKSLNDKQKGLVFTRRLIDDLLIKDAADIQWSEEKIRKYDELWRLFYSIFQTPFNLETISVDDFAFIMLLEQGTLVTGPAYSENLAESSEKVFTNVDDVLDVQKFEAVIKSVFDDPQSLQKLELVDLISRLLTKKIVDACSNHGENCIKEGNLTSEILRSAYVYNQPGLAPQFIRKSGTYLSESFGTYQFDNKTYLDLLNKFELVMGLNEGEERDKLYLESLVNLSDKIGYIHTTLQEMDNDLSVNGWKINDFDRYVNLLRTKYDLNSGTNKDNVLDVYEFILLSLLDLGFMRFPDEHSTNKDILDFEYYVDLIREFYLVAVYGKVENIEDNVLLEIIDEIKSLDFYYKDLYGIDNFQAIIYTLSKRFYEKCTNQELDCVRQYTLNSTNLPQKGESYNISYLIATNIYNREGRRYELNDYDYEWLVNDLGFVTKFEHSMDDEHIGDAYFANNNSVSNNSSLLSYINTTASNNFDLLQSKYNIFSDLLCFKEIFRVLRSNNYDVKKLEKVLQDYVDPTVSNIFKNYYEMSEDLYGENSNWNTNIPSSLTGEKVLDFDFTVNSTWAPRSTWIPSFVSDFTTSTFDLSSYIDKARGGDNRVEFPVDRVILTDFFPTGTMVQVVNQSSFQPSYYSADAKYFFVLNSDDQSLGNDVLFVQDDDLSTRRLLMYEIRDLHQYVSDMVIPALNQNMVSFIEQWENAKRIVDQN